VREGERLVGEAEDLRIVRVGGGGGAAASRCSSVAVCGVMPSGFMGAFLWIGIGAILSV
jgi:hypothetical protein